MERFVFCSCCFLARFLVVLRCQHGAFLEPKIDQHATCEFLMFIEFLLVFKSFLRLGGVLCWFYIGSFFASFFASIFGRFGGRFWGHFGSLWGFQIGHFWHRFFDDFCMSFQERLKSGQERPRAAQERPRAPQERPKSGQEQAKSGPRRPYTHAHTP